MSKDDRRKVTVVFLAGGGFHGATPALGADVIVVVDALDELARVPDLPKVIKVPVGDHETVLTLLERLQADCPEVRPLLAEYRRRPGVYLSSGMAQDPRLGRWAVEDLRRSGELDKVFNEVLIRLLEAANGQISLIEVQEQNSNAGGMGAGGGPLLGALFLAYAERRTNAQFRHVMLRAGGLTYARVAPGAFDNTCMTTESNIEAVLGHSFTRRTRDLEFYELPLRDEEGIALRDKREQRDALAGALMQARLSEGVAAVLDGREVNFKTTSLFGEMRRFRVGWSEFMDQTNLIRAAATSYRDQLKTFRTRPEPADMQVAGHVEVTLEAPDDPLPPVAEIMQAIRRGDTRTPLLDRFLGAELRSFRRTVLFYTTAEQAVSLDQILGRPGRPRNWDEVGAVARRFRGVIAHLERAGGEAEEAVRKAQGVLDKRRRRLNQEVRRLRSWRHPLESVVFSRKRVLRRFEMSLEAFREAHEQSSQAKARAEALTAAIEKVKSGLAGYQQHWVGRVEEELDETLNHQSLYLDTARFAGLKDIYTKLLDAIPRGLLKPVLVRAVASITLKGVGQMLGTDAEPRSLLTALEDGKRFRWLSPLWGGLVPSVEPRHRFVVFPPLNPEDLESLQKAAQESGFKPTLAAADTVAAGCSVVALSIFPVGKREEVLPPIYAPLEVPGETVQAVN